MADICPSEWQRYGESCYIVLDTKMTWMSANSICRGLQAAMVVPNSAGEQNFIWELYAKKFNEDPSGNLWIGCTNTSGEGVWYPCPLPNDVKEYENWLLGQPDSDTSTSCVVMRLSKGGKWADQRCDRNKNVACEQPTTDKSSPGEFCLQTGSTGRVVSRCLHNHVLNEIPGLGFFSCQRACRSEPRCTSFNLLGKGQGKMSCQLNDVPSHSAADRDITHDGDCYLFDL